MYHHRTDSEREAIYRRYIELKKELPYLNRTKLAERLGLKRTGLEWVIRWQNGK